MTHHNTGDDDNLKRQLPNQAEGEEGARGGGSSRKTPQVTPSQAEGSREVVDDMLEEQDDKE